MVRTRTNPRATSVSNETRDRSRACTRLLRCYTGTRWSGQGDRMILSTHYKTGTRGSELIGI
jgi:hypothetical protein